MRLGFVLDWVRTDAKELSGKYGELGLAKAHLTTPESFLSISIKSLFSIQASYCFVLSMQEEQCCLGWIALVC